MRQLVVLIALTVFLVACGSEPEPLCNSPYIQVGTECCLDANSNSICDADEPEPEPEPVPEPEPEQCIAEWKCSDWSVCSKDGSQSRVCRDENSCGLPTPDEERDCKPECTPDWDCGIWGECEDGRQTRVCTDSNDCATDEDKPDDSKSCEVVEEPEQIKLYGFDDLTTRSFALEEGLSVFTVSYDGSEFFSLSLETEAGTYMGLLFNTVGSFDGSQAMHIATGGMYQLVVDSDGQWELLIDQPRPSAADLLTDFEGTGPSVTELFYLEEGRSRFEMTHAGIGKFEVLLLDNRGESVATLADDEGVFDDGRTITIDDEGLYILNVKADGDWEISIE